MQAITPSVRQFVKVQHVLSADQLMSGRLGPGRILINKPGGPDIQMPEQSVAVTRYLVGENMDPLSLSKADIIKAAYDLVQGGAYKSYLPHGGVQVVRGPGRQPKEGEAPPAPPAPPVVTASPKRKRVRNRSKKAAAPVAALPAVAAVAAPVAPPPPPSGSLEGAPKRGRGRPRKYPLPSGEVAAPKPVKVAAPKPVKAALPKPVKVPAAKPVKAAAPKPTQAIAPIAPSAPTPEAPKRGRGRPRKYPMAAPSAPAAPAKAPKALPPARPMAKTPAIKPVAPKISALKVPPGTRADDPLQVKLAVVALLGTVKTLMQGADSKPGKRDRVAKISDVISEYSGDLKAAGWAA